VLSVHRIHIIGACGSGKSTLAAEVARRVWLPLFATDAWFWKEGWIAASPVEIAASVRCLFDTDRYVMDGNFDGCGTHRSLTM
jgi:adenylate kinase family enzyme